MPLYRYECPAGHATELLRPRTVEAVSCACGEVASRQAVNRIGVSGFAATPSEARDWREDFRRYKEAGDTLQYKKERYEDATQQRYADPPLHGLVVAEAKRLEQAGVTADQLST